MNPTKLDHNRVLGRRPRLDRRLRHGRTWGMHVIDRTDRFTLLGADARRGKLTLFAAKARGIAARSSTSPSALSISARPSPSCPTGSTSSVRARARRISTSVPKVCASVSSRRRRASTTNFDPRRAALGQPRRRPRPSTGHFGFAPAPPGAAGVPRVGVGGAFVEFHAGEPGTPDRPLLNHLAVLVESRTSTSRPPTTSASRSTRQNTSENRSSRIPTAPTNLKGGLIRQSIPSSFRIGFGESIDNPLRKNYLNWRKQTENRKKGKSSHFSQESMSQHAPRRSLPFLFLSAFGCSSVFLPPAQQKPSEMWLL